MNETIPRISIVEDQVSVSELLDCYLTRILGYKVVSVSGTVSAALIDLPAVKPDVVILDLGLPDKKPEDVIRSVMEIAGKAKVIVFSSLNNPFTIELLRKTRVHGYLDKWGDGVQRLKDAVTTVMAGKQYRPDWFDDACDDLRRGPNAVTNLLSDREKQVLALIGEAWADEQIGRKMGLTKYSAQVCRARIMKKLDLHSTPQLMKFAADNGFSGLQQATYSTVGGR